MDGKNKTIFAFVNPAWGHVKPLLCLVKELVRFGCTVRVYSGREVEKAIFEAGAEFTDCTRFFMKSDAPLSSAFGFLTALDAAANMDGFIRSEMDRWMPECAICDMESFWGSLICEKYGLHAILFSATQIRTLYSAGDYWGSFFRDLEPYEEALTRKLEGLSDKGFPKKSLMSLLCLPEKRECAAAIPEKWQPYPGLPELQQVLFTGCSRPMKRSERSAGVAASSRPRIYITLGTLYHATASFFRSCVEAFRDMDVEVVMAVWKYVDVRELGPLPEHIRVYRQVDQAEVLRNCDAAIFHGGMNTISDCLMLGIPMIIWPAIFDQTANAKRAEETGTGIRIRGYEPAVLRDAVMRILKDSSYRENAAALGEEMRNSPGSEGAARWILSRL